MKFHEVEQVRVECGMLRLVVDGAPLERAIEDLDPLLSNATEAQRRRIEVSPSGYGLHWPDLDLDLSIDGLLGIHHDRARDRRRA